MTQTKFANLSDEQMKQMKQIDRLESQLGVVLIAYEGYKQEDEQGRPQQQ